MGSAGLPRNGGRSSSSPPPKKNFLKNCIEGTPFCSSEQKRAAGRKLAPQPRRERFGREDAGTGQCFKGPRAAFVGFWEGIPGFFCLPFPQADPVAFSQGFWAQLGKAGASCARSWFGLSCSALGCAASSVGIFPICGSRFLSPPGFFRVWVEQTSAPPCSPDVSPRSSASFNSPNPINLGR